MRRRALTLFAVVLMTLACGGGVQEKPSPSLQARVDDAHGTEIKAQLAQISTHVK